MTNVFIAHSSRDNKVATRLYHWLKNFQLIEKIWIDIKELKPGMELEKSVREGIDNSEIIIIIVSRYSKDSKWVKREIKYSLKFQDTREKIVIPVLYKVKPEQVSLHNIHYQKLLKNIFVSLDESLFNIHSFIPSLIPEHHCLQVPFNNQFYVDIPELISNLKHSYESGKKTYTLINHEKIDKEIKAVLQEALDVDHSGFKSNPKEVMEDNRKLENIIVNLLPLYWINISFVLSRYVESLSVKVSLEVVATSIHNLVRELLHFLFLHFFDEISLSYSPAKKNEELKKMIIESSNYVFPVVGGMPINYYFICNLYYNNRVAPGELVEFTFVGKNVRPQKGRVRSAEYSDIINYPQPAFPLSEIRESDWYKIIVPQFLSFEIFRHTRNLRTFTDEDLEQIGLHLRNYNELYHTTW